MKGRARPERPSVDGVRIGRVASRTGLSVDAIRFYERLRLVASPPRSGAGYRLFREQDVAGLFFIERAQKMGFSLDEIRELLALRQRSESCSEVKELIESKLSIVRSKIRDLRGLERELSAALEECLEALSHHAAGRCPVLVELAPKSPGGKKRFPAGKK